MEFEQWEVMVRDAVKRARTSTEAWLDLLLMDSQASPMERFQIISLAEAPFVLLARQAMADRGVPVGGMARPELRIVEGASQDPAAGNPNTSAAAEYEHNSRQQVNARIPLRVRYNFHVCDARVRHKRACPGCGHERCDNCPQRLAHRPAEERYVITPIFNCC
jgi:hypothetical protein